MKKLKASALPTVMVLSVIILLLILLAYTLWDMSGLYYSTYRYQKQQQEHLNSAALLYYNDSSHVESLDRESGYTLFEDDERSKVFYNIKQWGFYECLTVSSYDASLHSTRFVGKAEESSHAAAIWICDRDMSLSIAGDTEIEGLVYVPKRGFNYIEMVSIPFTGEMISENSIRLSGRLLPAIDSSRIDYVSQLKEADISTSFTNTNAGYMSFGNETVHVAAPTITGNFTARGNVVLHGEDVTISSETKISDVILIARKVTIESGFEGSLQIFAGDTVIIEKNVRLRYPSGVYLNGNSGKTHLDLGQNSSIDGYAIVFGVHENITSFIPDINYHQREESILRGLLYVDGIANLKGNIHGAAYIGVCYYLSGEIMYQETLFNTGIRRSDEIAYPFLFSQGKYKRKEVKSVY